MWIWKSVRRTLAWSIHRNVGGKKIQSDFSYTGLKYTDIVYNCGIRFITRNNLRTLAEAESRADNIIVRGERQDVLPKTRVYGIIEFDILRINGPAITQKPRSNAVIFSLKEIERFNARTTRRPNIIIATVHRTIYRFVHRRIHPIGPIYNI